jgi:hypothetical protein
MTIPSDWFIEPPTINNGNGGITDLGNKILDLYQLYSQRFLTL